MNEDADAPAILVIVEGAKTDLRLMEHLLKVYSINRRHRIVSYKTNIYVLYSTLFKNKDSENLDTIDIMTHLREHESDVEQKRFLTLSLLMFF